MNISVIVQYKIETQTKDLDDVFYRAYSSDTRYSKVFKEITFLTNVAFHDFEQMGLILGNNVNAIKYKGLEYVNLLYPNDKDDDDDEESGESTAYGDREKFDGALVGDPLLIMSVGLVIMGMVRSSSLFDNIVDFDFTSLYPSIIRLFNIYKKTLIGQLGLDNSNIGERERRCVDDKYNRGAKFLDDLELNEALHFCYRWLNLPNMADVIREVDSILEEMDIKKVKVRRIKDKKEDTVKKVKVRRIS